MSLETTTRFKDAIWLPQGESVIIGGAGGIGSWLSLLLARMGFKILLFDDDLIEEHNLGGQLFSHQHLFLPKITAVENLVKSFSGSEISTFRQKITLETPTTYFMFGAFDNMEARKTMFEVWKRSITVREQDHIPILIDGRLEMEQLQIFCVTPQNMFEYEEKYLFDDNAVEDLPCTMKQTSHTAAMIASHMAAFFTNHIANIREGIVFRDVPFMYEYVVDLNLTREIRDVNLAT